MASTRDWALITGATGGLGRAFAKLFAADGINLVLTARKGPALASLATELEHDYGIKTFVYAGDLTDLAVVKELITVVDEAHIRTKYLVNNAGFGQYGPFTLTHWSNEHDMITVNLIALTFLTKAFARQMKQRGFGRIINIASLAAFLPGPNMAVYYATKAYVLSLSEAVHEELKGTGVTVTALCPGPTKTNFAEAADAASAQIFRGSLATPEHVARYGYHAMHRGKSLAIPSVGGHAFLWSLRLLPRRLTGRLARKLQS